MKLERLNIKELSPTGELLGVLTCHAGQITVFRAANNSDLTKYVRALAGVSGKERLSVSLGDEEYRPIDHNLIGFGERFGGGRGDSSVEHYLTEAGVPEQQIAATLSEGGLIERRDTLCSSLSADEERRLRILAATYQPEKALILNDPFDPISSAWRERFAELLNDFVKARNGLVVVPFLSYRPEAWIDNERVARLQVGQNVQKTIGFGTAPSQVHSIIEQIRSEAAAEHEPRPQADVLEPPAADAPSIDMPPKGEKRKPSALFLSLGTLTLVVVGMIIGINSLPISSEKSAERELVQVSEDKDESLQVAQATPDLPQATPLVSTAEEPPVAVPAVTPTAEPIQRVVRLIDLYPAPIRASIVESFEGVGSSLPRIAAADSPRLSRRQVANDSAPVRRNTSELLSVLETTSANTTEASQPVPQPSDSELEGMSPEQRREVIRQRFLEAIQRASQSQGQ